MTLGFAYQQLAFDSIESMDLKSIPAVFTHDNAELRGGREDVITTANAIDSKVGRSTAPPEIHFFRAADDSIGDRRIFTAFGHASGIGDITVRMKQRINSNPKNGLALGLDLRLPTGDERNLLGTGAAGLQPFAAWSANYETFSPHINLGYQWNGSSLLGGDLDSGVADGLPDVAVYAVGAVIAVHSRVSAAVDLLGRYIIDTPHVRRDEFQALDGRSVFPNITFDSGGIHQVSGAVGLKINLAGRLLVNTNLLVRLNNAGLRDKVSPLVGIEYAF